MTSRGGNVARPPTAADVTVVVVAWRSGETLDACLASVPGDGGPSVLVVDNDADAATQQVLRRWEDRVQVLRTGSNLGFAGGTAAALGAVTTPWVLLLNDDATLSPGALDHLLGALAGAGERCAGVQAAVVLAGTEPALTNSTGGMVTPDGFGYDRDWLRPWPVDRPAPDVAFGLCGAAALLSVAAVREAGGMDPALFLYYEDTDLSWRLRLAGYGFAWCPGAVVHHRHSASTGEGSDLALFHTERNRLLVLARDASWRLALVQWLRAPLTLASWTLRTPPATARTRVRARALASALRLLPRALRLRRAVRPRVPRAQVEALLAPAPTVLGGYRA